MNQRCVLTMHVPVVGHGVDLLAGQNLHMLAAGPAVQLVGPDQPAAHAVRHLALLAHMLREIRRGLVGYLQKLNVTGHQYIAFYFLVHVRILINYLYIRVLTRLFVSQFL